jgi:mannose-6-phosphate isomerase-like protein (cupin superfamily)
MSEVRRVVVGEDEEGRSIVVSDGPAEFRSMLPARELGVSDIWGADSRSEVPTDGALPDYRRFFPPAEGFRVMVLNIGAEGDADPDGIDIEAYQRRRREVFPNYHDDAVIDDPSSHLHRTFTVDVGVVLEGEATLSLDDGQAVTLKRGEFFVQNGARHSWHNPGRVPCSVAVFVLGADGRGEG